jgi:hypothetical protein
MYKPVKYNITFKDSPEATHIVDNDCPVRVRGCRENDLTHTTVDKVSTGLKKGLLCETYYSNEWRAVATAEECLVDS